MDASPRRPWATRCAAGGAGRLGEAFLPNSLLKKSPGEGTGPTSPMISEEIM